MRDNWIGNTALQERLQRADPDASVILEALNVVNADTILTAEQWAEADTTKDIQPTGDNDKVDEINEDASVEWTILRDGGVKIRGTFETLAEQATKSDAVVTDLNNTEAFRTLVVRVDDTHQGKELRRITAHLDPDTGGGVTVDEWRLAVLVPSELNRDFVTLRQIGSTVPVPHGGGTSSLDVTFDLRSNETSTPVIIPPGGNPDRNRELPEATGRADTRLYIIIWAVRGEGGPASNVAWLGDPDKNTDSGDGWTASHRNLNLVNRDRKAARGGEFEDIGSGTGIMHFKIETGSYSEQVIEFTGPDNRIDLAGGAVREVLP